MSVVFKVELDESGSAFGTAFSGTDESANVTQGLGFPPISVTWGRQDEFSAVTPTSVSNVFKNADGRFTPGLATSALYPKVRRGLRRRVTVTVSGTPVKISEDYATSIAVSPDRLLTTAQVDGSDILARLGGTPSSGTVSSTIVGTALRSFLAEEMLLDSPSALYMLQEEDGATSFADVTGKRPPLVVTKSKYGPGTVTAGQATSNTFNGGTVVTVNNPAYISGALSGSWIGGTTPDLSATTSYTVEAWVVAPTVAGFQAQILQMDNEDVAAGFTLPVTSLPRFIVQDGTHIDASTTFLDGGLHQLVGVVNGATATFYIDGVSVGSSACSSLNGPAPSRFALGMNDNTRGGHLPYSGGFAYAAVFPTALSSTRVVAHYNAGANAFVGERTDTRISRLLGYRTNTGSVLDTGLGTMGAQDIQGRSLTDCLLEVGQVEAGAVYVDGQGRVNFRSRSRLFNPTPVLTLDCSQGSVDFGSNFTDTTQNALNDVTVTGSTGSDQRFYNAASITADGELATSASLPLNADSDALNMAGWMVANGVQEQIVASPLNVDLLNCPAATALGVLQLAPLDCVQVTNCPTGAPAATLKFIVQGGSLSLAVDAASASLNTTLMPPAVAVWDSTNWDATPVWAF